MNQTNLATAREMLAIEMAAIRADLQGPPTQTALLSTVAEHMRAHPMLDQFAVYHVCPNHYRVGVVIRISGGGRTEAAVSVWASTLADAVTWAERYDGHVDAVTQGRIGGVQVEVVASIADDVVGPELGRHEWPRVPVSVSDIPKD